MADGSHYIKCDRCSAVLDRRPKDDWRDGGTFRVGLEPELRAYAASLGWTRLDDNTDLCPGCKPEQQ